MTSPSVSDSLKGSEPEPAKGLFVGTMVPEKNSIYALVYFAPPNEFETHHAEVEKMIDSFKIHAKGPIIQEDNSSSTGD